MNGKLVPILIGALLAANAMIGGYFSSQVTAQSLEIKKLTETMIEFKVDMKYMKEKINGIPK